MALVEDDVTHVWLAHVRGKTLLVGDATLLVSGVGGVEADPVLSSATAAIPSPDDVFGEWPDAAWLEAYDQTSDDAPRVAYRWMTDHWEKSAAWKGRATSLASWRDGVLVDQVEHWPKTVPPVDDPRLSFFTPDGAEHPPPPGQLLALPEATPERRVAPGVDSFASVDGALFVVAEAGKPNRLMVERWLPGGTSTDLYELAPREASAHLWVKTARDVVAFGGSTLADEKPILSHFDGDRWSALEAPRGVDIVVAYDRNDAGTERVFAFRGVELSCWERAASGPWQRLLLPAVGPGEAIDGHWLTEDDAWLHVRGPGREGRLLRLRPVTHVFHVGAASPIEPVAPGDDALAAAAQPAPAPAPRPDPSPFHDAVISYPDRDDAEVINALRLCPFTGRTLVCGVSAAPLVATDDGVVSDDALEAAIASGKGIGPGRLVFESGGAWPDSAWIVSGAAGTPERHAFLHKDGAWTEVADWALATDPYVEHVEAGFLVAPLISFRSGDAKGPSAQDYPLGLAQKGHDRLAPMATKLAPRVPLVPPDRGPVAAMVRAGDALFLAATRGGKLAVERQLHGADRVDEIGSVDRDGASYVALWAASPDDAAVFGAIAGAPLLRRFEGRAWTAVTPPSGVDRVAAYDRTAAGVERVFAYAGERLSLHERRSASEAWTPIALPTLPAGDRVHEVWLANDDAWLLVWPGGHGSAPRLMRMKPVSRVWAYPRELPEGLGF